MKYILITILFFGFLYKPDSISAQKMPPEWTKDAVWYQIFVERFYNGNTENDPRLQDIQGSWPQDKPDNWETSKWTSNWYEQTPWEKQTGHPFYYTVQYRRYGGDFEGVIKKIPHLKDLGINAVYFNPVNDSPSLHKYDSRAFRHMDRNFGTDPQRDAEIIATETPTDPATWKWTTADSLFLVLVAEFHKNDIKVIVDFSWNHTGITYWAWQDILKNQAKSEFADWYSIEKFDDPNTPENEFSYKGWAGVPELPEFKKIGRPVGKSHGAIPGNLTDAVKKHVFNVTKRWLDPNNDGDTSDGIDGFRLDVAEMVPLDFWVDYRKFVHSINPDAYLIGEVWWEQWPKTMYDPQPWLNDSIFDAVMNYRWYKETRAFFGDNKNAISAPEFVTHLDSVNLNSNYAPFLMNTMATHDTERLASSFANKNQYKFKVNPNDDKTYFSGHLSAKDQRNLQLALIHQYSWVGAPHIWNGDEFLMTGADDPDNRKPIWWPEFTFENESYVLANLLPDVKKANNKADYSMPVKANTEWTEFLKELIALRKQNAALKTEKVESFKALSKDVIQYNRNLKGDTSFIFIFNNSSTNSFLLDANLLKEYKMHQLKHFKSGTTFNKQKKSYNISPKDVLILKKR